MGTPIKVAATRGADREEKRIDQRPVRPLQELCKVVQRKFVVQHRAAKPHERYDDDGDKRHQRRGDDRPAIGRARDAQWAAHREQRRRAPRPGRVITPCQHVALDQQRDNRAENQQHAQHARRRRVGCGFADKQFESLHRKNRLVFGQNERHAEIFHCLDEYQKTAGQDRGHHDRQRDRAQHPQSGGTEILRCFFDGNVNRSERRYRRQHDIRIEREGVSHDDALHPVDRLERNPDAAHRAGHYPCRARTSAPARRR